MDIWGPLLLALSIHFCVCLFLPSHIPLTNTFSPFDKLSQTGYRRSALLLEEHAAVHQMPCLSPSRQSLLASHYLAQASRFY